QLPAEVHPPDGQDSQSSRFRRALGSDAGAQPPTDQPRRRRRKRHTGQSLVTPLSPRSVSSPVTLALTSATTVATDPGVSHHWAVSAVTSRSPLFGSSGPPSIKAPVKKPHSSLSRASSSTR